jgi:hypothetical protein
MLLTYYDDGEQELWVLSRDGATKGTLAKGLQPVASWRIDGWVCGRACRSWNKRNVEA